MRKKFPLVCLDRDGTIIKDDGKLYLGKTDDWMERVEFLPLVVEGIRLLNNNSIYPFITTNQAGVALTGGEFERLTERRMHRINEFILERLRERGARVMTYFACPYIDSAYAGQARKKGRKVNSHYVCDGHPDLKPNIGMVVKAARFSGRNLDNCNVFVVGDRFSDVEMGLNTGGMGILVPGIKTRELGDVERAEEAACKNPERVYIAKDFLNACEYVVRKVY